MSIFSDDRSSELRDLFFESASELLQALNEDGLKLEKHPKDAEILRQVRRTVHTLKGDSAACGFGELSSLAHELEDALTPEIAKKRGKRVAEVVLQAADAFGHLLAAYRASQPAPATEAVHQSIREMVGKGAAAAAKPAASQPLGQFRWTEYEQLMIDDAIRRGLKVIFVAIAIDPNCIVRAAAAQMAKNALADLGKVLVFHPDENTPVEKIDVIQAALTTSFDPEYVEKKSRIPAVTADVVVVRHQPILEPIVEVPVAVPQQAQPAGEEKAPAQEAAAAAAPMTAAPETTLRVDAERIDTVLNLVGELVIGKSMLMQAFSEFDKRFNKDPLRSKLADALAFQARVLSDLQKSVMKVRMVPVDQLFRRFPRVVRDVSKSVEKEVELVVSGQDTDLDKSVLDMLAEPLAHLVRNAISHGIESPVDRMATGKLRQGAIRLDAYHQGNSVVIEVKDDGAGIDRDKVVEKAIERGIISREEAGRLTENDALELIFHPGLSTADEVTAVSGRGVGMDVVKSVVERLKGTVHIDTRPGQGTTFYLKVPLTLAIIKALMFRVGEKLYAVPLGVVTEITRAHESEIHTVDNREVLRLRDQVLTLVRLSRLNDLRSANNAKFFIVIIQIGDRKFGLVVDKLVGEEELVIKSMDDQLVATDLVSGASILGDGTVVLILNIHAVVTRLGRSDESLRKPREATA